MAVPLLHRSDTALARLGPWEPAQRYWQGNEPEIDVVARSVDGKRLLAGEAKWTTRQLDASRTVAHLSAGSLPGAADAEVCKALFVPERRAADSETGVHVVDAATVMGLLG